MAIMRGRAVQLTHPFEKYMYICMRTKNLLNLFDSCCQRLFIAIFLPIRSIIAPKKLVSWPKRELDGTNK